jgi:hypothetical protein
MMRTWIVLSSLVALSMAASSCQREATSPPLASSTAAPSANQPAVAEQPTQAVPVAHVDICSLLSAAEVSAIMGKRLVQQPHSCDYNLDASAKEKALADAGVKEGNDSAQNMGAMMKTFQKGGVGSLNKMTGTMMDMMTVSVSADQENTTEQKVKDVYAKVGSTVNQALHPEEHNLEGVIQVGDEISGVGDWAFATNVANVNVMGMSVRGRLLHVGKGPWHLVVSATVSPDPTVAVLDKQLADVARALIAKL